MARAKAGRRMVVALTIMDDGLGAQRQPWWKEAQFDMPDCMDALLPAARGLDKKRQIRGGYFALEQGTVGIQYATPVTEAQP